MQKVSRLYKHLEFNLDPRNHQNKKKKEEENFQK